MVDFVSKGAITNYTFENVKSRRFIQPPSLRPTIHHSLGEWTWQHHAVGHDNRRRRRQPDLPDDPGSGIHRLYVVVDGNMWAAHELYLHRVTWNTQSSHISGSQVMPPISLRDLIRQACLPALLFMCAPAV